MYNISTITSALENLVGFNDETGYPLSAPLTSPDSTLIVNGYEALLTLQTLDSVKPSNLSLDDFLIKVRKQSVQKVIADIVSTKIGKEFQKSVLEETPIINGTANPSNIENKKGRFVGWLFRLPESINLRHTIQKVMLQFSENVSNLPLHVYHSSQVDPINTILVTTTNAPSVSTVTLEIPEVLQYMTDATDVGGFYMIGYYEDDLAPTTNAIYKEIVVGDLPCSSCDPWMKQYYKKWNNYLKTKAVYVDSQNLSGTDMPNLDHIQNATKTNFGLNFYFSIGCDLTDFIISHKNMFSQAIQTRIAMDLMRYIETSPTRNNKVADSSAKEASIRINGIISENNFIKVRGLIHDYEQFIKSASFDFSRLDKYCLPNARTGIRWNV